MKKGEKTLIYLYLYVKLVQQNNVGNSKINSYIYIQMEVVYNNII